MDIHIRYWQALKIFFKFLSVFIFLFFSFKLWKHMNPERNMDFSGQKNILLDDNGSVFNIKINSASVSGVLAEKNISLNEKDRLFPQDDSKLFPGMTIRIERAIPVSISADGKTVSGFTFSKTVRGAVKENGIELSRLDKTDPDPGSLPLPNQKIIVTRINVEEITQNEDIDFKTITKNDSRLGWREKKIETPGEKGIREVVYRITYKNGKEVSRVPLSKKVTKDPVTQVETQGTYVKTGESKKGQATWYAYQGGLFAASTTIPRGSYAKVTNTATGKSIIVQINDYGPQGKGRIIDLDKVAFQKIASLGAGVIGVKVEEVLN